MQPSTDITFDATSALAQGSREHQEDAVIADFPLGSDTGIVVLSDGMGGHAAGDIASKIVMTEVFCELKFQSGDPEALSANAADILRGAAHGANECLAAHIAENPDARGMGATLIAAVFRDNRLNWISVGDSPLFLFRDGVLRQLNEDHSMAPQIDLMVDTGLIDSETARDHPDRNALTSVLCGDEIARIDCPGEGLDLRDGDLVIAASDGLQFVDEARLGALLGTHRTANSAKIARALLRELASLDDPDQDNISMTVVRVETAEAQDAVTAAVRSAFDFASLAAVADDAGAEEAEPEAAFVPHEVWSEDMAEADAAAGDPEAEADPGPEIDFDALVKTVQAQTPQAAGAEAAPDGEPDAAEDAASRPQPALDFDFAALVEAAQPDPDEADEPDDFVTTDDPEAGLSAESESEEDNLFAGDLPGTDAEMDAEDGEPPLFAPGMDESAGETAADDNADEEADTPILSQADRAGPVMPRRVSLRNSAADLRAEITEAAR